MYFSADNILRHKPPFRFIETFNSYNGGLAEADIQSFETLPPWMISTECSTLPVEFAAQLMGARYRLDREQPVKCGFISKIKFFGWTRHAEQIVSLRVQLGQSQGEFHDFSAQFFGVAGDVCANLQATLYFSDKAGHHNDLLVSPEIATDKQNDVPAGDKLFLKANNEVKEGEVAFVLNAGCSVYNGHFPNNPITPGILLVDAMIEAAINSKGNKGERRLQLVSVQNTVFHALVFPRDNIIIKIRETQNSLDIQNFKASIFNNGKRCSRAKFTLRKV